MACSQSIGILLMQLFNKQTRKTIEYMTKLLERFTKKDGTYSDQYSKQGMYKYNYSVFMQLLGYGQGVTVIIPS